MILAYQNTRMPKFLYYIFSTNNGSHSINNFFKLMSCFSYKITIYLLNKTNNNETYMDIPLFCGFVRKYLK